MQLEVTGSAEEQLLFQLVGIEAWDGESPAGLLVGKGGQIPEDEEVLYVVLPDPNNPLGENERLATVLGRAVGLGKAAL